MPKKIGIIDLGSNSVRLVIFEVKKNGAFRLIDDINDPIRLMENMIYNKFLNDLAMHRAIKTIKLYKKLCNAYEINSNRIIGVATAAVRTAENQEHFLRLLANSTGINFKVLSGKEESLYVHKAISNSIDINQGIIVDIGGGSTEIIKFKDKSIKNYACLPIGSVFATEKFLDKNIIPPHKLNDLDKYINKLLSASDWLFEETNPVLIGIGGVIRNLGKIHRKHVDYPINQTHNYQMSIENFHCVYNTLKGTDLETRKNIEGLSKNRADIIVGGLSILSSIISAISPKKLIISGFGLREGILYNHLFSNTKLNPQEDVLSLSLYSFMNLYGVRQNHAEQVCFLSLSLFDQLKPLHKFSDSERRLIKVASLLHDIGISISYYEHHKHSFYIILNSRLNGLSHREIVLIAAIAASHSDKPFNAEWKSKYSSILLPGDVEICEKLSIFLKLSECLDRSEMGIIKSIECQISDASVKIQTIKDGDAELELSLSNEYSDLFKKYFGKTLNIL
ncbi:Ppx/GppA phosphatase family protein [Herbivorax sp. ANBcel31]|uniref:Ppx/GppA phosphatase family protein n=1 Tax=Herbivorax sp. ANBcel31 TaxID=3069754 RepID=UPI0027B6453F|nr:Ppx/GppA phosphatase family protein [Herbivorax sp. ANBcel31]MDQ2086382.1 Ppx/GppA phosphatase family protein [Herbivorax sp. ANBcel31]